MQSPCFWESIPDRVDYILHAECWCAPDAYLFRRCGRDFFFLVLFVPLEVSIIASARVCVCVCLYVPRPAVFRLLLFFSRCFPVLLFYFFSSRWAVGNGGFRDGEAKFDLRCASLVCFLSSLSAGWRMYYVASRTKWRRVGEGGRGVLRRSTTSPEKLARKHRTMPGA